MGKYNVVQKRKRAEKAVRKRAVHGDPTTGKLKQKGQLHSVSSKRQRKLFKKWRREQKDAVDKGLVSMQDVEMAEEGTSQDAKFHVKKGFKLKKFKARGKKTKTTSKPAAAEASQDAMVE